MTLTPSYYVLEHKKCGHPGALGPDRSAIEAQLRIVVAAGYHQWELRELDEAGLDAVIDVIATNPTCATCRMDPSRGATPAARAVAREERAAGHMPATRIVVGPT